MSTISRQFGLGNPSPLTVPNAPLATAAYSPLPRAPVQSTGFTRPFGDTGLTSRCPESMPAAGTWQEAWSAPLDANVPPAFVAASSDRILVQGGGAWTLFDTAGHRVATQRSGPGPAFLDPAHNRLMFVDRDDQVIALNQRDGSFDFRIPIPFGDLFAKPLVAFAGNSLVVAAVEHEGVPHRPSPPNTSALQVIDTGSPLTRFDDGMLSSLTRDEKLLINSVGLLATIQNGRLVAAWPNRFMQLGLDLQVRTVYEARFEPGLMAEDEAGRAYIILANEQNERALWIISETGQRILSVPLPRDLGTLFFPPIIGFDHRIHILTTSRILALAPTGERLWMASARAEFTGATVTADGFILAGDGRDVVAFAANGSPRVLTQLPGPVRTPPVLGKDQVLLVAETGKLHGFRRR